MFNVQTSAGSLGKSFQVNFNQLSGLQEADSPSDIISQVEAVLHWVMGVTHMMG